MKLTVRENREAIRRYGHIKPAPRLGAARCSASCPGTKRTCTLERSGIRVQEPEGKAKRAASAIQRGGSWDKGPIANLAAFGRGILRRVPPMEETLFIVFFVAMVGFFIDWALRIIWGG
jgi:hypothetical protein